MEEAESVRANEDLKIIINFHHSQSHKWEDRHIKIMEIIYDLKLNVKRNKYETTLERRHMSWKALIRIIKKHQTMRLR